MDGVEELLLAASGEISPSNTTLEDNIARDGPIEEGEVKCDAAWTVPGYVVDCYGLP